MNNTLISYITELNTNPALLAQHQENIEQSAANYGLSPADINVLNNEALTKEYVGFSPKKVKNIIIYSFTKH